MHLDDAIEHLYVTFARYGVGRVVEGCPCCVGLALGSQLALAPLRAIPRDLLRRYASKAMTTWGTDDDFKHFVPAIWEEMTTGDLGRDPQTIYSKLPYAEWRGWREPEQAALVEVTVAWLDAILTGRVRRPWEARDVVECAGLAGMDVLPLIALLDRSAGPSAASAVAELARARGRRWIWWKTDDARALDAWIDRAAAQRLEEAFFAFPDHEDARNWSEGHENLAPSGEVRLSR